MHIKDPFIFTSFIAFLLAGRMMGCAAGGWCWFRPDARVEVVEAPVSLLQLILGVDRKFIRFGGGRHPLGKPTPSKTDEFSEKFIILCKWSWLTLVTS